MSYRHSNEYVVKYIHRHLQEGHSLPDILDHLAKHNVDKNTIYEVLKEMPLTDQVAVDEEVIDVGEPTSFMSELTIYEYLLGTALLGLIILATFSSVIVTLLLLVAIFGVGYAYVGGQRWPELFMFSFMWIGFFLLLRYESVTIAAMFLILFSVLIGVLHVSRRKISVPV